VFHVGESGTTLRFLLSLAALTDHKTVIKGRGTLNSRPNKPLIDVLRGQGAKIKGTGTKDATPIVVGKGAIRAGRIEIDGSLSSQFISSLLILSPKLSQKTKLKVTGPFLVSRPYIDMTLLVLKKAGIKIKKLTQRSYAINGRQQYRGLGSFKIPADYGLSAFFMAAAALTNSDILIQGLRENGMVQADKKILKLFKKMGVKFSISKTSLKIKGPCELRGSNLFCRDCPDLVPILGVVALFSKGRTKIYGIEHVRAKESNRISDLKTELCKVCARIKELKDGLIIFPLSYNKAKTGKILDPHQDHRLAMAFCILGLKVGLTVKDIECVRKSYPNFLAGLAKIKAKFKLV